MKDPNTFETERGHTMRLKVKMILRLVGPISALALFAVSCGGSGSSGSPTSPSTPTSASTPVGATLTITDAGVSSALLRISLNERVQVINNSSTTHEMQSSPHPTHSDCPPMNQPGVLPPGGSGFTAAFTLAGTCGFHDNLDDTNTSLQGQLLVGVDQPGGTPGY